ncbi:response regulator transcription factor [Plantibacter sp. YIM 135249]|uniref:response regulator transcription factor n=1 Tax=Plantibacter sp. YIM 135249 TaxID=3423918 RepID=UPI003D3330B7
MRILVVEDDRDLAETLREALRAEGMTVDVALDGAAALERLGEIDIDVLVLDRDLPRVSGDVVCRTLRSLNDDTRVLMLTAAAGVSDRVDGLDLGADDYLAKPSAFVELVARIRALGRRARPRVGPILVHGPLRLDTVRRRAFIHEQAIRLSPKELEVLEALLRADGRALSSEQLLDIAWETPDTISRGVVKVLMHSLRRKLALDLIEHDAGHGYRMVDQ